jgi:hypothetical protein
MIMKKIYILELNKIKIFLKNFIILNIIELLIILEYMVVIFILLDMILMIILYSENVLKVNLCGLVMITTNMIYIIPI